MRIRLKIVSLFFFACFLAIIVKLFYWQVIKGKVLSSQAQDQHRQNYQINAPRGSIMASDGQWLAARTLSYLVFANLTETNISADSIADKLAPLFVGKEDVEEQDYKKIVLDEASRIKSLLSKNELVWVPLKHKVSKEVRDEINYLNIAGIGFEEEEDRFYPESSASAHLLGFVGKDEQGEDTGYFGLEGYYNLTLSGREGYLATEKDARGSQILVGDLDEYTAVGGVDLITHIDRGIQLVLEEKLSQGIEKYGAKAATAIIMDPYSGAILAMSSLPGYEPDKYYDYTNELFKNPAVSVSFEPGSVFKVLIMAAALDAGAVEPDTKCDICAGPVKVDKYIIETWNREYQTDPNMVDVIVHSNNVGMVFVAQKLGIERLFDYLQRFGIGQLTGIDLQGESTPKLRSLSDWSIVDLSTAAFGQGIAVTPIQMIKAVSIIANGGYQIEPQVVNKLVIDGWEEDIRSQRGERVISKQVVEDITAMMVEAAKSGEARWTHTRGFDVAGKTGTAQIPIAGHYDEEKTIASFVGFAPAENPKFVMIITLREPETSPWASETAAPLWFSIAKELFMYFGIQPKS